MDETKRLQLIAEAVKYCQKVKAMGMPSSCYTKALRETIHFLWERRMGASPGRNCGPKVSAAVFRSRSSCGLAIGGGKLIYHHAIPFEQLQKELLCLTDLNIRSIKKVLKKLCVPVLITKKEHQRLHGRGNRNPGVEKQVNAVAGLRAAGLKMVRNASHYKS